MVCVSGVANLYADCQLLKIFALLFIYTLPWVAANELVRSDAFITSHSVARVNLSQICFGPLDRLQGMWSPLIQGILAVGFFGLDAVGAELEGPFGN